MDERKPYENAHHLALKNRPKGMEWIEEHEKELLQKIKLNLSPLETLLTKANECYEDSIYRLYHQSFKVYRLRDITREIVDAIRKVQPEGTSFNAYFSQIVTDCEAVGEWNDSHNRDWLSHTRPIVEAFFHARYFLEMLVKYASHEPTALLPSGWAAVLYLFYLR